MSYPPPPPSGPDDSAGAPPPPDGATTPPPPPPPPPYGSTPPPPAPPYGGATPPPPGAYPPAPGGYYGPPPAAGNQKALWALILGIAGILCCGPAAIVAIVLGNQAKKEIRASGGTQTGDGQAQAGFVLGIVGCVLWFAIVVFYVLGVAVARSGSA